MPRFYLNTNLILGETLTLPDTVVRHIHVLRLKPDTEIILFNGNGRAYTAILNTLNKRYAEATIIQESEVQTESPLKLILIQAISSGDRMDFTLQKSVELGISEIWPIFSERSIVRLTGDRAEKKTARWQDIVISACEQSGRNSIPTVYPPCQFEEALKRIPSGYTKLLLSLNQATRLANLPHTEQACLLIGPEGGWSTAEENTAKNLGFQAITLGPRVLRTETASLAALAAMQTLWGDF